MTSRTLLSIVFLSLLALSSLGCPNKKDGAAAAEGTGSATPAAAKAPKDDDKGADKDGDKDDDEDEEKDGKGDKKDEGGW